MENLQDVVANAMNISESEPVTETPTDTSTETQPVEQPTESEPTEQQVQQPDTNRDNSTIKQMREQIAQYKQSMQNDTLNLKNDTLNDTLKLSEKEKTVLEIIKSDLNITTDQIVQAAGFSRPTVMRAIKTLKEKKLLERLDSKKTGSWKVNAFPFS